MKHNLSGLNEALFAQLEILQNTDAFKDEKGEVDQNKAEAAIKQADAVQNIAARILDAQRLQLDVVKTAYNAGFNVKVPEVLGLEVMKAENK